MTVPDFRRLLPPSASRGASLAIVAALSIAMASCAVGRPIRSTDGGTDSGTDARVDSGPSQNGCGNGVLNEGETCDPAYVGSEFGANCLCDDNNACTIDRCKEGTDADSCSCICENVYNGTDYGVGSCNDSDTCTSDTVACADPDDTRTPEECASACKVSCTHVTIPQCTKGCGNGVADPGETCERDLPGLPPSGLPQCGTCDDGLPCTLDSASGSAATCTQICSHQPVVDWAAIQCNDGKDCTSDYVTSFNPTTCAYTCSNPQNELWRLAFEATCDDGKTCTYGQAVVDDWNTCAVHCEFPIINNWWVTANCEDGRICTDGAVATHDNDTCGFTCAQALNPGYVAEALLACDDGKSCTADTGTVSPTTCATLCSFTTIQNWWATVCNDGNAATTDIVQSHNDNDCTFVCTHMVNADAPDDAFADTNGDGIDGDIPFMIFVDTTLGNDTTGTGSPSAPFKTINKGIATAFQQPSVYVAVASGTYNERVELKSGVSVYGGYVHTVTSGVHNWARNANPASRAIIANSVVANGAVESVVGVDLTAPLTFEYLAVQSANATGNAISNYGIRIANSTAAVTLRFVSAVGGAASAGTAPSRAATGAQGGNGGSVPTVMVSTVLGGAAGVNNACANVTGGSGGNGGAQTGGCAEAGSGASGNRPPNYPSCNVGSGGGRATCGDYTPGNGGAGSTCGSVGTPGGAGGAATTRGSVVNHRWVPSTGTAGGVGGAGAPGSGGGGGGGDVWSGGEDYNRGGGGGGGGAGGCGGNGGAGGQSGGSSFGLFVSSAPIVFGPSCSFAGGAAGGGSAGGAGGFGGGGGAGGTGRPYSGDGGGGGNGGSGTAGGEGGVGGGGAGGLSFGAFYCSATVSGATPTYAGGMAGAGNGGAVAGLSGPQTVLSGSCSQ